MLISTRGRYALRLMVCIAKHNSDEYVSLRTIHEEEQISLKYLEQLARPLIRDGLLKSSRGKLGGYGLSRPADTIRVGDILRAAEGSTVPVNCVALEGTFDCPHEAYCHNAAFWVGLNDVIENYVDSVMLADLLRNKGVSKETPVCTKGGM